MFSIPYIEEKFKFRVLNHMLLDGGVTNNSYLIETDNGKYILRISGYGTSKYIDRDSEKYNLSIVAKLGISPKIFYIDSEIILMEYIDTNNYKLNKNIIYNSNMLTNVINVLYVLHSSKMQFYKEFNILKLIYLYKKTIDEMNKDLPLELKKIEFLLQDKLNILMSKYDKELVPCHIDPKFDNFLVSDNKIYLIDWEYSNMADVYFELANFSLTNNLNEDEEKIILETYFEISSQNFLLEKYILYKIVTDYLWIYWHLIKLYQGENIGYNKEKWIERLNRALKNIEILEGI